MHRCTASESAETRSTDPAPASGGAHARGRDHARLDRRDLFPNPVVVVVDVDTEEINLPRHAALFEERIDVLGDDKGLICRQPAVVDERPKI